MEDEATKAIRDYDAADPYWKQEKGEREIREANEAKAREQRAVEARRQAEIQPQQQVASSPTKAWCDWIDGRIKEAFRVNQESLYDALGEFIFALWPRGYSRSFFGVAAVATTGGDKAITY
jgi:hypothetical protein